MSSLKHEELLLPLIESSSDPQHPHISLDANCEVKQEFFCENILALMLHALLLVDFGIFFYREDPSVENLEWKLVSFSIVLYMCERSRTSARKRGRIACTIEQRCENEDLEIDIVARDIALLRLRISRWYR
jgi:hypothetical protein